MSTIAIADNIESRRGTGASPTDELGSRRGTGASPNDELGSRRRPRTGDPLARALAPHADTAYALLRIVAGLLFAFHGAQKLFDLYMPVEIPIGSQVWIGGVIELVTGLAIAAGVRTTWAAFLASGTMAVAYVQFHWRLDLGAKFLPAVNGGEPALIYSVLFLYIACRGGRPIWSSRRA